MTEQLWDNCEVGQFSKGVESERESNAAHSYNGVHLRRCDLLGSLHGAHDLLLMLEHRHNTVMIDCWASLRPSAAESGGQIHCWKCLCHYLLWQVRQHLSTNPIQSLHYFSLQRKKQMEERSDQTITTCGIIKTSIIRDDNHLFMHFNVQSIGHFIVL